MILIADGGSTKADWVALDKNTGEELFRTRTHSINPESLNEEDIKGRVVHNFQLEKPKEEVAQVYFYGAGCGTENNKVFLKDILKTIFVNAEIVVEEDMLAAVFAASAGEESIVCILGTGSNSCYYDGCTMSQNVVSLGYLLMDEASGNYFGRHLLRDYYYKQMPENIVQTFEKEYDLSPTTVKHNLYKEEMPNTYLGDFARIMFDFKEEKYIHDLLEKGFREFYELRVLPYPKAKNVPIYFIGSIAYFFRPILEKVALELGLNLKGVVRRPIQNLITYHQNLLKS